MARLAGQLQGINDQAQANRRLLLSLQWISVQLGPVQSKTNYSGRYNKCQEQTIRKHGATKRTCW